MQMHGARDYAHQRYAISESKSDHPSILMLNSISAQFTANVPTLSVKG